MPYITQKDRKPYEKLILDLSKFLKQKKVTNKSSIITSIIIDLIQDVYPDRLTYSKHNEIIGMLSCCMQEWQRRKSLSGYCTDPLMVNSRPDLKGKVKALTINLAHKIKVSTCAYSVPGHLNYCITRLLTETFSPLSSLTPLEQEDILDILASIHLYWYEQHTAPYEDLKIEENGDVLESISIAPRKKKSNNILRYITFWNKKNTSSSITVDSTADQISIRKDWDWYFSNPSFLDNEDILSKSDSDKSKKVGTIAIILIWCIVVGITLYNTIKLWL